MPSVPRNPTNGRNGVNGVWKSIALVSVSVMVAGAPGMVYAIRTWSINEEVQRIRERQDNVRERLAGVEIQLNRLEADHENLRTQIAAIQFQVNERRSP